jgi:hypothetical protein
MRCDVERTTLSRGYSWVEIPADGEFHIFFQEYYLKGTHLIKPHRSFLREALDIFLSVLHHQCHGSLYTSWRTVWSNLETYPSRGLSNRLLRIVTRKVFFTHIPGDCSGHNCHTSVIIRRCISIRGTVFRLWIHFFWTGKLWIKYLG